MWDLECLCFVYTCVCVRMEKMQEKKYDDMETRVIFISCRRHFKFPSYVYVKAYIVFNPLKYTACKR